MAIEDLNNIGNNANVNYDEVSQNFGANYSEPENSLQGEQPRGVNEQNVKAKKSLFNNFYVFSGDNTNIYLDEDTQAADKFKNPSIQNLVANKQGANRFDYSDFAYCKLLGEIRNNHLVTLRRFKYPVYDDIFVGNHEPDIARLVTWSTANENSLKDIMSMSFGLNWKQLTASFEEMSIAGNQIGYDGLVGKILDKYLSPNTNPQEYYNPQHDQNKVYGPVDSIHQTHIRDIGLKFDQKLELTFRYELRSIDGVNPKTAFLDLISHVLACTMNDGKFWGGARYWNGRPPSEHAKRIRHWTNEKFAEFAQSSNVNVKSLFASAMQSLSSVSAQQVIDLAGQALKNMAISKVLDIAGRASVPMMNSLLTSDAVGEWHVTIGNPFRPTLVMGNMILKNTTISIDDTVLGYDDFPTGLIVKCELEHAMPRDRAGIESMYKSGNGRSYWKPTKQDFDKITKQGNYVKDSMIGHSSSNIAVVGRELYSYAKTQLYGYSDAMQPKSAGTATNTNAAPNNTTVQTKQ